MHNFLYRHPIKAERQLRFHEDSLYTFHPISCKMAIHVSWPLNGALKPMSFIIAIKKELNTANLLGLFILLITGLVLSPLAPKPNPNVSGIYLPTTMATPAPIAPDTVAVLQLPPTNATVVGLIHTHIHYDSISQSSDDQNIANTLATARNLAAQNGANGIVITKIGRSFEEGPLDAFELDATAVEMPAS